MNRTDPMHGPVRVRTDPNGKDGAAGAGAGGVSSNGSLSGAASSASISATDSIDGGNGNGGVANDSAANALQDSLNEKLAKVMSHSLCEFE